MVMAYMVLAFAITSCFLVLNHANTDGLAGGRVWRQVYYTITLRASAVMDGRNITRLLVCRLTWNRPFAATV